MVLLKSAFALPKLQYLLRLYPAYLTAVELRAFDKLLRVALSAVSDVNVVGGAWEQASLLVKMGGLGVRMAEDVALPAFLSSLHLLGDLVEAILSSVNMADTSKLVDG